MNDLLNMSNAAHDAAVDALASVVATAPNVGTVVAMDGPEWEAGGDVAKMGDAQLRKELAELPEPGSVITLAQQNMTRVSAEAEREIAELKRLVGAAQTEFQASMDKAIAIRQRAEAIKAEMARRAR